MNTKLLNVCITVVCLVMTPGMGYAQAGWHDEMLKAGDTLQQIRWVLKTFNEEEKYAVSYMEMLEHAANVSAQIHNDTMLAKCSYNLGGLYLRKGMAEKSWASFTKAKLLYLKEKQYTNVANALYSQSTVLIVQNLPDSLIRFLNHNSRFISVAGDEGTKLRWKFMYPLAYQTSGRDKDAKAEFLRLFPLIRAYNDTQLLLSLIINVGMLDNNFDSSMVWYSKGLDLARSAFPEKYVELLFKIGYAYSQRDDKLRDSALYYFLEAEKDIDKLKNPVFKANIENVTGDFFVTRKEYGLALPYMYKAYEYSKNLGVVHVNTAVHNLAVCFMGLRQKDSAAHYLELNRKSVDVVNDDYHYMLYYHAKAEFETLGGDSCSMMVLTNYTKTIDYAIKCEENRVGASTLISACQCVLQGDRKKMGRMASAMIGYCRIYYEPMKEEKTRKHRFAEFLTQYAKLEAVYGDKVKANELYEELTGILLDVNDENYTKGIGEAVVKYKSDLKDTEIALLNERERVATIRIALIVAGLVVMVCVAVMVFGLYKREHKTRQMLDERNHKVEQLLREVHHRVKNNLQIISSFINIQLDKVKDNEARDALDDTSTRIMALAGLHQSLYRQDDLSRIQIDEYIQELCKALGSGINKNVQINCDLENLQMDIDQAIPIGLAINELITNALKHAFPQKQNAQIDVELKHKNKWQLTVKDNGLGLPENMNPASLDSIGIRLVQDIAEQQLKGTFTFYNDGGAVFKIEFVPAAA